MPAANNFTLVSPAVTSRRIIGEDRQRLYFALPSRYVAARGAFLCEQGKNSSPFKFRPRVADGLQQTNNQRRYASCHRVRGNPKPGTSSAWN